MTPIPPQHGAHLRATLDHIPVPAGALAIQFHGQASLAIKTASDTIIYFDPYYSDYLDRVSHGLPYATTRRFTAPLTPAEVTNADLVCITHDHLDHLDPGTIPALAMASPGARFIVPQAGRQHLLDLGVAPTRIAAIHIAAADTLAAPLHVGDITVTAIKGNHDGFDYVDADGYPWLGYVLRIGDVTFFHAGDTQPYAGQIEALRSLAIDVACLPINGGSFRTRTLGFKGNLTPHEAADLGMSIGADWIIPIHYGALSENDEQGYRFVAYSEERYPFQRFHLLRPGETILYGRWDALASSATTGGRA